jgi:hypothetical protein
MKTIITTATAALFAAAEIYDVLGKGNPDLSTQRVSAEDFAGVQPSVGDDISVYHGLAEGNADLFKGDDVQTRPSTGLPDIYQGVRGNPDLSI